VISIQRKNKPAGFTERKVEKEGTNNCENELLRNGILEIIIK